MSEIIRVAVGIVPQQNKVLICQRPLGKPYSGYWEFPGGKIETNENGLAAIKRELHEEIGINVLEAIFLFDHQYDYPDKTVFLELWQITRYQGEPYGKEQQNIGWATYHDLQQLPILEGNLPILEKIYPLIRPS